MSLFDLTLRNVRRNFRLYSIYLASMVLGVIIHFTFSSLMFNDDLLNALRNRDNFEVGVFIGTTVVFLFILFFILYANSFFMRQRKKEFGMYLLLGLSERQITLMVFYETLFVGAVSLVSGMLVGGLLSKLFGMILMNLMQYDNVISLAFPLKAVVSTVALFFLLAVIITVQSHIMVRRVQLVELFRAKEKSETPVKSSSVLALLAILLLGTAFLFIGSGAESSLWKDHGSLSLITVAVGFIGGTYLFFRQFAGWWLQFIGKRKRYHEGDTVLWTSSLRFQVRSNTLNLTFISLFSAVIILLTCFVTINYKVQFEAVRYNIPDDIAFQTQDETTNAKIEAAIQVSEHPVKEHRTLEALVTTPVTGRELAFENAEYFESQVLLVSAKDYNEIVAARGDDQQVQLQGDETVSLSQGTDLAEIYAAGWQPEFRVKLGSESDEELALRLTEKKDYALLGWSTNSKTSMDIKQAVLVVSDGKYDQLKASAPARTFELYRIESAKNAEALSAEVQGMVRGASPDAYYSSFADVYSKQIESSALLLFASGFLALIAMFALASVIYFKQLREATEEQQRYSILAKLGVGSGTMKRVIRKQLLFVFSPPLALGVLQSWFVIHFFILSSVRNFPELPGLVLGILAVYFLIYGLLYLSSTNLYYRIVTGRQ